MREAVIVASSRTPLAKSYRGIVQHDAARRSGRALHLATSSSKAPDLDAEEIEEVVLGCGQPHGPAGHNVARVATLRAGLPVTTAARDRQPLLQLGPAGDRAGRASS